MMNRPSQMCPYSRWRLVPVVGLPLEWERLGKLGPGNCPYSPTQNYHDTVARAKIKCISRLLSTTATLYYWTWTVLKHKTSIFQLQEHMIQHPSSKIGMSRLVIQLSDNMLLPKSLSKTVEAHTNRISRLCVNKKIPTCSSCCESWLNCCTLSWAMSIVCWEPEPDLFAMVAVITFVLKRYRDNPYQRSLPHLTVDGATADGWQRTSRRHVLAGNASKFLKNTALSCYYLFVNKCHSLCR